MKKRDITNFQASFLVCIIMEKTSSKKKVEEMSSAFAIIPSPESRENIKIISYDVAAVRDTLSNARLVRDNELVLRVKRSRLE